MTEFLKTAPPALVAELRSRLHPAPAPALSTPTAIVTDIGAGLPGPNDDLKKKLADQLKAKDAIKTVVGETPKRPPLRDGDPRSFGDQVKDICTDLGRFDPRMPDPVDPNVPIEEQDIPDEPLSFSEPLPDSDIELKYMDMVNQRQMECAEKLGKDVSGVKWAQPSEELPTEAKLNEAHNAYWNRGYMENPPTVAITGYSEPGEPPTAISPGSPEYWVKEVKAYIANGRVDRKAQQLLIGCKMPPAHRYPTGVWEHVSTQAKSWLSDDGWLLPNIRFLLTLRKPWAAPSLSDCLIAMAYFEAISIQA